MPDGLLQSGPRPGTHTRVLFFNPICGRPSPVYALKIEEKLHCVCVCTQNLSTICWPTFRDFIGQNCQSKNSGPRTHLVLQDGALLSIHVIFCFFFQDAEVFCSVWSVFRREPPQTISALSEQQLDPWFLPHRLVIMLFKSLFLIYSALFVSVLCVYFFSLFGNHRGEING